MIDPPTAAAVDLAACRPPAPEYPRRLEVLSLSDGGWAVRADGRTALFSECEAACRCANDLVHPANRLTHEGHC